MTINRDRIIVALAAALAVVPTAAIKGVPWWVVATSAMATFLGALVKFEEVIAPTPKAPTPTPAPEPLQ